MPPKNFPSAREPFLYKHLIALTVDYLFIWCMIALLEYLNLGVLILVHISVS